MKDYQVIIIGSGPGGYVCAIRCAQLGMKVALIEKYNTLGGTCLNVGCIPSKALLDSSEHFHAATHKFADHGIKTGKLSVDMPQMIARKNEVVAQTCDGVAYLMKKNKIDVYYGTGSFVDKNTVEVALNEGDPVQLKGEKIVIATGSKPVAPASFNYDKERIITSTEALNINKVPKSMTIIGAGVIGLELGSVYARLGTKVEVVEYTDKLIGTMDGDMGKELAKVLKKLGFTFYLNHEVKSVTSNGKTTNLEARNRKTDEIISIEAEYTLISIGRKPYTDNLKLENAGVELDERGKVIVNDQLQTNVPHIFAIGDVVRGAMLAHKAEEEGVVLAEYLDGQKPHINYLLVPNVVYTWPEVASVGYTEEELKEKKMEYKKGKFPFKALGRARASADTDGLVKVLADKKTDEVLGVHIIGPRAADMIAQAVAQMEFRATAEDMARNCYAHPTFMEAVKEAALAATDNRALHM